MIRRDEELVEAEDDAERRQRHRAATTTPASARLLHGLEVRCRASTWTSHLSTVLARSGRERWPWTGAFFLEVPRARQYPGLGHGDEEDEEPASFPRRRRVPGILTPERHGPQGPGHSCLEDARVVLCHEGPGLQVFHSASAEGG